MKKSLAQNSVTLVLILVLIPASSLAADFKRETIYQ